MEVKGVFFDLFGTLVDATDTKGAWNAWLSAFYRSLVQIGLQMTESDFSELCDNFMSKEEPLDKGENLTVYERRIKQLCIDLKIPVKNSEINQIAIKTIKEWEKFIKIDPETIPLLELLKKRMKLALITNYDHYPYIRKFIKELKIDTYFETITISSEIGKKKPDPDIFNQSIINSGLKPSEIAYVGDSDVDLIGAKSSGMIPILIKRNREYPLQDYQSKGYNSKSETVLDVQDVIVVKSLKELEDLIL